MTLFEDWLRSHRNPCILRYAKLLLELGASWETFKRKEEEIMADLIRGGIPPLAARTIVGLSQNALQSRSQALFILWDLESVPLPAHCSGSDVANRIKSLLAPYGDLKQFRGYASLGLNQISERNRSELHFAGCQLVDCPHNGRTGAIDKMIIVDAMEFAYTNLEEGTSICLITGDVDYAYLLSKLRNPRWKTIVISKGPRESLLPLNCDVTFQWEADIMQLSFSLPPPGFLSLPSRTESVNSSIRSISSLFLDQQQSARPSYPNLIASNNDIIQRGVIAPDAWKEQTARDAAALSPNSEIDTSDVKLLRSMITNYAHVGGDNPGTLKCHVGSLLRQQYPNRFPDRNSLQLFLSKAINSGLVKETNHEGTRLLHLPEEFHKVNTVSPSNIALSKNMPVPMADIPVKVMEASIHSPFVLFLKKFQIPPDSKFPDKVYVQSSGKWILLLFRSLLDAQRAVNAKPWLATGTLIDLREMGEPHKPNETVAPIETFKCQSCKMTFPITESFLHTGYDYRLCRSCFIADASLWNSNEKSKAAAKVVSMLEMMAENDDVSVPRNIIRKSIFERWPDYCASRGQAALWVEAALETNRVLELRSFGAGKTRTKLVCLAGNSKWATMPWPDAETDTSEEETFTHNLLWEQGSLRRSDLVLILQNKFSSMSTPLMRTRMFLNAATKNKFFIAKDGYGQVVGLSKEDASHALKIMTDHQAENFANDMKMKAPFASVVASAALAASATLAAPAAPANPQISMDEASVSDSDTSIDLQRLLK